MHSIELTLEELDVLREVLRYKLDEADVEMSRTDTLHFKQMLKHRRELLERILTKIKAVPIAV